MQRAVIVVALIYGRVMPAYPPWNTCSALPVPLIHAERPDVSRGRNFLYKAKDKAWRAGAGSSGHGLDCRRCFAGVLFSCVGWFNTITSEQYNSRARACGKWYSSRNPGSYNSRARVCVCRFLCQEITDYVHSRTHAHMHAHTHTCTPKHNTHTHSHTCTLAHALTHTHTRKLTHTDTV